MKNHSMSLEEAIALIPTNVGAEIPVDGIISDAEIEQLIFDVDADSPSIRAAVRCVANAMASATEVNELPDRYSWVGRLPDGRVLTSGSDWECPELELHTAAEWQDLLEEDRL